jgi:hypothetical protein
MDRCFRRIFPFHPNQVRSHCLALPRLAGFNSFYRTMPFDWMSTCYVPFYLLCVCPCMGAPLEKQIIGYFFVSRLQPAFRGVGTLERKESRRQLLGVSSRENWPWTLPLRNALWVTLCFSVLHFRGISVFAMDDLIGTLRYALRLSFHYSRMFSTSISAGTARVSNG